MPNGTNIPAPPALFGDALHRVEQLYTYLFKLSEQLAIILNGISPAETAQAGSTSSDAFLIRQDLHRQISDTAAALRREIKAVSLTSLGMRRGQTEAVTLAGGASADIEVEFAALGNAPVVVAGITGSGGDALCQVLTETISTGGFTVRVTNHADTEQSYSVAWIATA